MHQLNKWFASILIGYALVGCSDYQPQTESMQRYQTAQEKVQNYVDKAAKELSGEVLNKPGEHIPKILYAHELLASAEKTYKQADIIGVKNETLKKLKSELRIANAALAAEALRIMQHMAFKTEDVRAEVIKLKQASTSSEVGSIDTSRQLNSLSEKFNDQLADCCLTNLYKINGILMREKNKKYDLVHSLINSATEDLLVILEDPPQLSTYLTRLALTAETVGVPFNKKDVKAHEGYPQTRGQ